MKSIFKSFMLAVALIFFISSSLFAAEKHKSEKVTIQTSAICESCKARIEKALKATDGIEEANLNLNSEKIKVKYDPSKINADQIRTVISNTGYDADQVKRNEEAFNNLPHCCQRPEGDAVKGGHHHNE